MLINFFVWFIEYGFSFLLANIFDGLEQERMFYCIYFLVPIILLTIRVVALIIQIELISNLLGEEADHGVNGIVTCVIALNILKNVIVLIVVTWVITKIFYTDFFVAFQIITFGQCLCSTEQED